MAPHAERKFDVILYGATGYTGKLTAKYLDSLPELADRPAASPQLDLVGGEGLHNVDRSEGDAEGDHVWGHPPPSERRPFVAEVEGGDERSSSFAIEFKGRLKEQGLQRYFKPVVRLGVKSWLDLSEVIEDDLYAMHARMRHGTQHDTPRAQLRGGCARERVASNAMGWRWGHTG